MEIWGKMRKVELLSTRDCEAGYAPVFLKTLYLCGYLALISDFVALWAHRTE